MKVHIVMFTVLFTFFIGVAVYAQENVITSSTSKLNERVGPEKTGATVVNNGGEPWVFLPVISQPQIANAYELQVLNITNNERSQAGCPPLRLNTQLLAAARGHSQDMADNDFFSHTGSNGSSPWDRIEATGYQFSSAAENIAAGYGTPEDVMNGWMNSSGHRANILNCNLEEIGVGYVYLAQDTGDVNYRSYWTQVFATPQ